MRRLSKLLLLPMGERWLLLQAVCSIWTIRAALSLLPYRAVRRGIDLVAHPTRDANHSIDLDRLSWLLQVAGRTLPSRKPCLSVALGSFVLLRRRGYSADVRIGVARDESRQLLAHAWLECEGRIIVGAEGSERYAVLASPREPRCPAVD